MRRGSGIQLWALATGKAMEERGGNAPLTAAQVVDVRKESRVIQCASDLCGAAQLAAPKNTHSHCSSIKTKHRGVFFFGLKSRKLPMGLH